MGPEEFISNGCPLHNNPLPFSNSASWTPRANLVVLDLLPGEEPSEELPWHRTECTLLSQIEISSCSIGLPLLGSSKQEISSSIELFQVLYSSIELFIIYNIIINFKFYRVILFRKTAINLVLLVSYPSPSFNLQRSYFLRITRPTDTPRSQYFVCVLSLSYLFLFSD